MIPSQFSILSLFFRVVLAFLLFFLPGHELVVWLILDMPGKHCNSILD